jgi:glycosidase
MHVSILHKKMPVGLLIGKYVIKINKLQKPENMNTKIIIKKTLTLACVGFLASCASDRHQSSNLQAVSAYGTLNPFASEQIYFLLTDRFVDGDPLNNHTDQGGKYKTFNVPLYGPNGMHDNIGYMGGDFQGIIDHAQYIKDMGFTALWTTPIFDNPDEAFSGGQKTEFGSVGTDGGKTGYHGYWGVNFYKVDEHLESPGLSFADFTRTLREKYELKYVLDIVANHGSPSYSMPVSQASMGKIYDEQGKLVADHQNLHPSKLDPNNPLHKFFNNKPGLAQLSDINENNPEVLDYFVNSYFKWIDQGAYALRVDTIKEMPHHFWKKVADRVQERHPGMFMFGESYSYDANFIAEHTRPENGGYSVLDFPGRQAIVNVFEQDNSDYASILSYLHLKDRMYQNPYELVTFYDNHDMARMNASDEGFINANNWLFTSRGIPCIYYGSEANFSTGLKEHEGNRNYFGKERIEAAKNHAIHNNLTKIAHIRKNSIALQRGLQVNLEFKGNTASFYRIYQHEGVNQTALVVLNKSNAAQSVTLDNMLIPGKWRDAANDKHIHITAKQSRVKIDVPGNGVRVLLLDQVINNPDVIQEINASMAAL